MDQLEQQDLPQWLSLAVQESVVSLQEAQQINWVCLASTEEWALMPESLWMAAEKLALWEAEASTLPS